MHAHPIAILMGTTATATSAVPYREHRSHTAPALSTAQLHLSPSCSPMADSGLIRVHVYLVIQVFVYEGITNEISLEQDRAAVQG